MICTPTTTTTTLPHRMINKGCEIASKGSSASGVSSSSGSSSSSSSIVSKSELELMIKRSDRKGIILDLDWIRLDWIRLDLVRLYKTR